MKVIAAEFTVEVPGNSYRVRFRGDSVEIVCFMTGVTYPFTNDKKRWKPCATHAMDLVRMVTTVPTKSPWSKARAKATKPILKIAE